MSGEGDSRKAAAYNRRPSRLDPLVELRFGHHMGAVDERVQSVSGRLALRHPDVRLKAFGNIVRQSISYLSRIHLDSSFTFPRRQASIPYPILVAHINVSVV